MIPANGHVPKRATSQADMTTTYQRRSGAAVPAGR
jgi:hypothetical protein